jgi:uncharacterized protein (TIGR00369 family)
MDNTQSPPAREAVHLPELMGLEWIESRPGFVSGRFVVQRHHMAPNGFLHAASVIALLDSACGFGCMISRPEGAIGFTTIELKTNFLGTTRQGEVTGEARLVHGGRTTQVWDAEAKSGDKTLAIFRCTQLLLYPQA